MIESIIYFVIGWNIRAVWTYCLLFLSDFFTFVHLQPKLDKIFEPWIIGENRYYHIWSIWNALLHRVHVYYRPCLQQFHLVSILQPTAAHHVNFSSYSVTFCGLLHFCRFAFQIVTLLFKITRILMIGDVELF